MRRIAVIVFLFIFFVSSGRAFAAGTHILIEANTGTVISEEGADEKRSAASLTKLMSFLIFAEALDSGSVSLSDSVSVSGEAAKKGGTRVFLDAGTQYDFEKLLEAAIICSANDATAALAEYCCGSESAFVDRMNERAQEMSLSCVFENATGLENENQLISAADLAKIAAELSKHSVFFKYSGTYSGTFVHESGGTTEMVNANRLIRQDTYTGMATGSSDSAGYCAAISADFGQARYIAVVLGEANSSDRFSKADTLIGEAAAAYTVKHITKAGQLIKKNYPVSGGTRAAVNIVAATDCTVLLKKGEDAGLIKAFEMEDSLEAPIAVGDVVGMMHVYSGEEEIAAVELIASESSGVKTLWSCVLEILSIWLG